jgi:hypothetical protein
MRAELAARLRAFVDASLAGAPTESFDALALDLCRWQRAQAPHLAALGPEPTRWQDIPAVPVDLFKSMRIGTVRPDEPSVVFRTSGTTQGLRGEHHARDTALYDHAAPRWAAACVPDAPRRVVALLHDPAETPDSSLSHMVADFGDVTWHLRHGRLDLASLTGAIGPHPVYVCATAFALADWLDSAPDPLPAGSVVMVTGGFKGRRTELSDGDLYAAARAILQPARLVTEYGMTELSSQLWAPPGAPYVPPPWLRVLAVDPGTGAPLPPGVHGQLRFVDLLNLDSTVAIETLDGGVVDDRGHVTLHGRLPGASLRGCSLTVEEARAVAPPPRRTLPDPGAAGMPATSRLVDVLAWRDALRADAGNAPTEGLSPEGRDLVLAHALDALDEASLARVPIRRAWRSATFVAARTVATAPIEWIALLLLRGTPVVLKHPAATGAFAGWLARHARAVGLPLSATSDRSAVDDAELVLAMGNDASMDAIRARATGTLHTFGHRFSAAYWGPDAPVEAFAEAVATDLAAHDSRGCMSPAVVLCAADLEVALPALAAAMTAAEARWPRGALGPAELADLRTRRALARASGGASHLGDGWQIDVLAAEHATPSALPRAVQLVPVAPDDAWSVLAPWQDALSTVGGTVDWPVPTHTRRTAAGLMQAPPLIRHHDGVSTVGITQV